MIEIDLSRK